MNEQFPPSDSFERVVMQIQSQFTIGELIEIFKSAKLVMNDLYERCDYPWSHDSFCDFICNAIVFVTTATWYDANLSGPAEEKDKFIFNLMHEYIDLRQADDSLFRSDVVQQLLAGIGIDFNYRLTLPKECFMLHDNDHSTEEMMEDFGLEAVLIESDLPDWIFCPRERRAYILEQIAAKNPDFVLQFKV